MSNRVVGEEIALWMGIVSTITSVLGDDLYHLTSNDCDEEQIAYEYAPHQFRFWTTTAIKKPRS